MADIAVTPAQVDTVYSVDARVRAHTAAVAITAGQALYLNTAAKLALASAAASNAAAQHYGTALDTVAAGSTCNVCIDGELYGFTLAGIAYYGPVFLSNTAGAYADAAGTVAIPVGRVVPINDKPTYTKVMRVYDNPSKNW